MGKPNVPLISNIFHSPMIFIYLTNKRIYLTNQNMWYHSDFKVHVGCFGILQNINVFTSSIKHFFCKHVYSQNLCYQDSQLRTVID